MKACPRCGNSFEDGFLVCPQDHVALIDGTPEPDLPSNPTDFTDFTGAPLSSASIDSSLEGLAESPSPSQTPPGTDLSAPPPDEEALPSGTLLGNYRLLSVLGEGGMGFVYEAEHTRLGRKVAIKLLRTEFASNPKAAHRFFSEARAVNQIAHENIIQITDFIDDQGPEKYYMMELLRGEDLAARMRKSVVPMRQLLEICVQVCNALSAVHTAGMVHRDLKPENIYLIDHAGNPNFVKLLDFGVVKLGNLVEAAERSTTAAGSILGTPEYMSPEQVSSNPVDHRTDIYALGVILYEGVTGRKPFAAKSFGEIVVSHLTVKPPRPSALKDLPQGIPAKLENLILQCLAKDRDNRPQSMAEIEQVLRRLLANLTVSELAAPPRRSRVPLAVAITLFLLAGAAGGIYTLRERGMLFAAAAPAPASAVVQVAFESQPQGAEVYIDDESEPIGMTPFAAELQRTESAKTFRFELPGHQSASQSVPLQQNTRVAVALAELEPGPALEATPSVPNPKTPRKSKRPTRRGTINPFD